MIRIVARAAVRLEFYAIHSKVRGGKYLIANMDCCIPTILIFALFAIEVLLISIGASARPITTASAIAERGVEFQHGTCIKDHFAHFLPPGLPQKAAARSGPADGCIPRKPPVTVKCTKM